MAKVLGIGGVFFTSKKKKALLAWYRKHLGLDVQAWGGVMFPWEGPGSREIHTVWTPFDAGTRHFGPSKHGYMVNYVVDDLDGLFAKLKKARVRVDPKGIEDTEYGRFAWAFDPEGRKLELWEPPRRKR
jgi:hypothetical protein